ncbi:fructose-6-phosphate aldolase [Collinsella sp. zg1085]|uniref:transaldolase family protein n=1 Tax=Collinsella sp. zg1085 TaxID=2844380 RepID=UPI001C0BA7F4|nr:transaldolase family protein [Collinsella sp. zg1085]QWT18014.1 fructose-6-phosphate aldolase [Collinsella sp. zg1085]
MEFMLDTADINQIKQLDKLITVAGVTTNPTIITASGKRVETVIEELCDYLAPNQKLFFQTVSQTPEGMLDEARAICALRPQNTYVKIPVTHAGMQVIKAAKQEGLGVLATAIYSADQAFLAAMNGADYLAPYVNRMCNYGDGVAQVLDLLAMLEKQQVDARVIAASFKSTDQVHRLIAAGIHAVTVPPAVVFAMLDHPGTELAVQEFSAAWSKSFGRESFSA